MKAQHASVQFFGEDVTNGFTRRLTFHVERLASVVGGEAGDAVETGFEFSGGHGRSKGECGKQAQDG